jgi:large subunit ribosomal protein L17
VPHQVHERKFGRLRGHRRSMLRNLSLSVLRYERVKTTEAKAKNVRMFVDQMINLGKDGTLDARRRALAWLPEPVIVEKVFSDLSLRWPDRRSGYARITRLPPRVGDAAKQMLIELLPGAEKSQDGAKAAAGATEEKPRRRLSLRRGPAEKKPEAEPKAEAKAETKKRAPAKRATTTKKKTKGAAT